MAAPTVGDLGAFVDTLPPADLLALESTLKSAISWVEKHAGPFGTPRSWSRTIRTGGGVVRLGVPALLSVSSITTATATTVAFDADSVDPATSTVAVYPVSPKPLTFTGLHGYPTGEPGEMTEAVLALARHWWSARSGTDTPRRPDGYVAPQLKGYAVPSAVRQLVLSATNLHPHA